jgi:hypothetical protein
MSSALGRGASERKTSEGRDLGVVRVAGEGEELGADLNGVAEPPDGRQHDELRRVGARARQRTRRTTTRGDGLGCDG